MNYSLNLAQSNIYLQVTIQSLEPKLYNIKFDIFYKIKNRIKFQLTH